MLGEAGKACVCGVQTVYRHLSFVISLPSRKAAQRVCGAALEGNAR